MKARLHKSRQQLDTMSASTAENVGFRWLKYLTLITDSVPTAQRWLCHTERQHCASRPIVATAPFFSMTLIPNKSTLDACIKHCSENSRGSVAEATSLVCEQFAVTDVETLKVGQTDI